MAQIIKNPLVKPFVKWVGGKKQLMDYINLYKPKSFGRYYEPFVGGGSVFMTFQHPKTTINDFNNELINVYE
ncbi:DNA adenine methylase, partial [Listeria monocytogenes]|nr:DNA adenine methylase [Listeria monocytogenes]